MWQLDKDRALAFVRGRMFARLSTLVLVLALGYSLYALLISASDGTRVMDDAYMFARYAENMLAGEGLAWNPGERAFGCTSVAYALFIALAKFITADALLNGALLSVSSWLWGMAALLVAYIALRGFFNGHGPLLRVLMAFIIITPPFMRALLSGMDTTMSVFMNALLIFLLVRHDGGERGAWHIALIALVAYMAFLVRPDSGVYALVLPVLFLVHNGVGKRAVVVFLAVFSCLMGLDALMKYSYFGSALPLSFYVKSAGFYSGYAGEDKWNNLRYLRDFLLYYGWTLLPALMMLNARMLRLLAVFLLPVALTAAYLMGFVQIMGFESRFFLPSMPVVLMGAGYAMAHGSGEFRPGLRRQSPIVASVLLLVVLTVLADVRDRRLYKESQQLYREHHALIMPGARECGQVGYLEAMGKLSHLVKSLPRGISVAASEHGYIASENPGTRVIDLLGLHSRELALGGYSDGYLKRERPDIIWMPHMDYTGLRERIMAGAFFKESYQFMPRALTYGVALKKDSPHISSGQRKLIWEYLNCSQ